MNKVDSQAIKPFLSVIAIILTLFAIVFLQMEERRAGYMSLKLARQHRELLDQKRGLEIQLAKITRPQLLEKVAQDRLTLKRAHAGQIIQLTGEGMKSASRDREL